MAFTPIVDCLSPGQGLDHEGPTAVLRSAGKLPHLRITSGAPLNQKFTPAMLATDQDIDNFVTYLRTFDDLGICHLQVNVVSADFLRKAVEEPEKYKNVMIRVSSYIAYFTELDPVTQQDIIRRTEQLRW